MRLVVEFVLVVEVVVVVVVVFLVVVLVAVAVVFVRVVVVGVVVGVVISHPVNTPATCWLMASFRASTATLHSELSIKNPAKQTTFSVLPSLGPVTSLMILLNAVTVSKHVLPNEGTNESKSSDPSGEHVTAPWVNLCSQPINTLFR